MLPLGDIEIDTTLRMVGQTFSFSLAEECLVSKSHTARGIFLLIWTIFRYELSSHKLSHINFFSLKLIVTLFTRSPPF